MSGGKSKVTVHALLCWVFVMFFSVLQFDLQIVQSFFTTELQKDYGLSSVGLASLSSAYFYIYILMQIPVGIMLAKYRIKYILPIAAITAGLGCVIFALSKSIWIAYLGRYLMGGGSAFAYVAMLMVIRVMLPRRYFIIFVGIGELISLAGAGLLENVFSILIFNFGWRYTMHLTGIILLFLAIIFYGLFYRYKSASENESELVKEGTFIKLKQVITNKKVLLACLYTFGMYSIVSGYASLWAVPSLKASYSFIMHAQNPDLVSANIVQMILIGIGVGSPILSWLVGRYISLTRCMYICAIIAFVLMIFLVLITVHTEFYLIIAFFAIGLICSSYVLAFPLAEQSAKPGNEAIALAVVNLFVAGGNIVLQPILGLFIDWHHEAYSSASILPINHDYNFALWVIPVMFLVSIFAIRKYISIDKRLEA